MIDQGPGDVAFGRQHRHRADPHPQVLAQRRLARIAGVDRVYARDIGQSQRKLQRAGVQVGTARASAGRMAADR